MARKLLKLLSSGGAGASAPFTQHDWPLSLRASGRAPDQALNRSLPLYNGRDTFFGAAGEPPKPFAWQNPVRRSADPNLYSYVDGSEFWLLAPAAQAPFKPIDWLNPQRPRQPNVGFALSLSLTLLGKDQFFGAAGEPPKPFSWQNPRGRQHPTSLYGFTDAYPNRSVIQAPFAQYDWPLPVRRQSTSTSFIDAWPNRNVVVQPFSQTDWPNPIRRAAPQVGFVGPINLDLLSQDQFFGAPGLAPTYDYPNPRGALRTIAHQGFISSTKIPLVGQDQLFGAPGQVPAFDWPNPLRTRFSHQACFGWFSSISLEVELEVLPFAQSDWPNPQRRLSHANVGWFASTPLGLQAAIPFAQSDWPLPRVSTHHQARQLSASNTTLILSGLPLYTPRQDAGALLI